MLTDNAPDTSTGMKPDASAKKTLLIVFFTVFLDLVGFGIIIPIQPFLAETLGATPKLVTLLGASFSLMQFLFAPFWGRLSDKIGRRPVMLSSIAITAVGYVVFGLAKSLPLLFLARLLAGFGAANIGTAQAIIADSTTPEKRAKGMGIIGAAFGLGFIFGPAIGGAFSQISLSTPLFVAAGLAVANWISAFFLLPETYRPGAMVTHSAADAHPFFSFRRFHGYGRYPNVPRLFVIFFIFTTAFSLMEQVLGLFVEGHWTHGLSGAAAHKQAAALTTYALVVVGVTATIIQGGLIGRLVAKYGERKLLLVGTLCIALSFALIPIAGARSEFWLLLVCSLMMAAGTGLTNPSLASYLSRSVEKDRQGSTLGLGQSLSAMGRIVGPACAGLLFERSSALPFWIGSALLFFCAFISFSLTTGNFELRPQTQS